MVRCGIWKCVYGTKRPTILEVQMVELCVNGNWKIWFPYCAGGTVSIHMVGKGTAGFSNVKKHYTKYTKLVVMR